MTIIETGSSVAPYQPSFPSRQALSPSANAGAVSIEIERAVAEAQGQLILAKRFPRDLNAAYAELMESCKLPALASVAFYNVPRGGGKVSGPSIRLAEEIARIYGNFEYGHRELSRGDGKSEVEVYAWDKQQNNRSLRQITVEHVMDTRDGPKKLRDQKDIDDKIANVASKQVRGRILALLPKFMVEAAIQECKKTLAGDNAVPLAERVRKMTQAFAPYGVTVAMLEVHLEHKLDAVTADEFADLYGIYNAIKDGAKPSDYFGAQKDEPEASAAASKIAGAAKAGEKKTEQKAERAAEPAQEPRQAASEPRPEPVHQPAAEAVHEPAAEESVF